MKKAIGITIGSTLAISALIGVSVFIPAAKNAIGVSPYVVKNVNSFNVNSAKSLNVSFKEALLGTEKINHGNYVLYFGNLALNKNANFFVGTNNNQPYNEKDLAVNSPFNLNGDYGNAIRYLNANTNNFSVVPQMLAYVYSITPFMYSQKIAYDKMVNEYKNLKTVDDDNKAIPENLKKRNWAKNAPQFSFKPADKYIDYENKQQYFISQQQGKNFVEIATFLKKRFKDAKDLVQSPGFIIGYKNGMAVSKFADSYNEPPKKNNQPNNPLGGLNNPNIFPHSSINTIKTIQYSDTNEPTNNSFYT